MADLETNNQNALNAPRRASEKKNRSEEIVQGTMMRNKLYPKLKKLDDLENVHYLELYTPLSGIDRKKLSKEQLEFRNVMNDTRKALGTNADQYMNEIFKASTHKEFDEAIAANQIIKKSELTGGKYMKLKNGWEKYELYRKRMENQLNVEDVVQKDKETILSRPTKYKKSAEHYIATNVQTFRENWGALDGKEKFVAGLSLLIGTSYFLNSTNKHAIKIRAMLGKALTVGVLAYGVNTVSKLTGKSLAEHGRAYVDDKSGKRDFYKDAFETDKYGAETMNASIVHLGNYDFIQLTDKYINTRAGLDQTHAEEKGRELYVAGVSDSDLSKREIYTSFTMLDKKLKREGTSLEELQKKLKEYKAQAKQNNEVFAAPTFAQVVTQILQKDIKGFVIENGKIKLATTKEIEALKWGPEQLGATTKWWLFTGAPFEFVEKPTEQKNTPNLRHISKTVIDDKRRLTDFATQKNFGRYALSVNALCEHKYEKKKANFHIMENPKDAAYIIQREKVDPGMPLDRNGNNVNTVQKAYQNAVLNLGKQYKGNLEITKLIKNKEIHKYLQPIGGVWQAPKGKKGELDYPTHYVMFLRLALPSSFEFKAREKEEWPEGDMIYMIDKAPMIKGDKLSWSDFKSIASAPFKSKTINHAEYIKFAKSIGLPDMFIPNATVINNGNTEAILKEAFKGAHKAFLKNLGLPENTNEHETNVILAAISEHYIGIGSGMTKPGLIRYLATHKFTDAEKAKFGGTLKKQNGGKVLGTKLKLGKSAESNKKTLKLKKGIKVLKGELEDINNQITTWEIEIANPTQSWNVDPEQTLDELKNNHSLKEKELDKAKQKLKKLENK